MKKAGLFAQSLGLSKNYQDFYAAIQEQHSVQEQLIIIIRAISKISDDSSLQQMKDFIEQQINIFCSKKEKIDNETERSTV